MSITPVGSKGNLPSAKKQKEPKQPDKITDKIIPILGTSFPEVRVISCGTLTACKICSSDFDEVYNCFHLVRPHQK